MLHLPASDADCKELSLVVMVGMITSPWMAQVYLDGSYDVRVRSLTLGYGYASSVVHHVVSRPDYTVVFKR